MRDAQGNEYWQWCAAEDFAAFEGGAEWDAAHRAVTLASRLAAPPAAATAAAAFAAAATPPIALDAWGGWARVVATAGQDRLLAGGAVEPEVEIWAAPPGRTIRDLAVTSRDWLIVALDDGAIFVRDLLGRFGDTVLTEPGFAPDRVAEAGDGTLWLVDRAAGAIRRLAGNPVPDRVLARRRDAGRFQPRPLDPDPLRIAPVEVAPLAASVVDALGLPDGRLALLCLGAGDQTELRFTDGRTLGEPVRPRGLAGAFSVGLFGRDRLAFALPGAAAAAVTPLTETPDLPLLGERPPFRTGTGGRFCKSRPGEPLHYPSAPDPRGDGPPRPFIRLVAPSRPARARDGRAVAVTAEADRDGFLWNRLYVEAHLPPGCGLTIAVAAADDRDALAAVPLAPHQVGEARGAGPRAVWLDQDSEIGWRRPATGTRRKRDRCGLFSLLLQKPGPAPRRIAGRFLRLEVALSGPTLSTPRLFAIRVWGGADRWRDRYLPAYLGATEGPLAEGADFLDRYLAVIEGLLTPIEDEVAASWRLTRADAAPEGALDWLAEWIGAEPDPALPVATRRALIANAVPLWKRRGTLDGFERMLDLVTAGAVRRGEIVVLEHFHLRRTLSTILGTDLSGQANPLIPGSRGSGNSFLGPSFFLGREESRAFLALFRPEAGIGGTVDEQAAALAEVEALLEDHAHRVTVLIHTALSPELRGLVARTVAREVPAHVLATIADGPGSLVLALSSLVGVETRLGPPPPKRPLTLGSAEIGQVFITDAPSLDPRLEGGA